MPEFKDIIKSLPEDTKNSITPLWEKLPEEDRENLQGIFQGLPIDMNLADSLLDLVWVQIKMALGRKHHVAIVGPANAGKSTLYNQFIRSKGDKAEVAPIPGTTRVNQEADAGLFAIVDTPGADAVGEVGETEKLEALSAAERADFLVIIFDAQQGIRRSELSLFTELVALKKPFIVALNKIDLIKREHQADVIQRAATNLMLEKHQVIPLSAQKGKGITQVLMGIAAADPEMTIALAQALPQYRWRLAWRSIVTAASISAAIALIPLPVIDFVPLVVTQTTMVLTIARIYNFKITAARAKELIATFGLGMLGRTLFQQLSKLGGIPGWVLSAAIASSTTVVMGYAACAWFDKGERVSSEAMKKLTKKITADLLKSLKRKGKKKLSKKEMEQTIVDVLEDAPISDFQVMDNIAHTGTDPDNPAQTIVDIEPTMEG